jgi:iron complex transport system ATP-binding protein
MSGFTYEMRAEGIHAAFAERRVLEGVSLTAKQGEVLGILGTNGAGKTTLLRILAGLHACASGQVTFAGKPLGEVTHLARKLAYLEQNTLCHWPMSVERLVALGRLPHLPVGKPLADADHQAVEQAMREADVWHLRARAATTLSTGEQARAFLARALAVQPQMLLVDEPVAGLDPAHQLSVMELLAQKAAEGMGVVAVLHDLPLAARFCDRIVLLHEGCVLAIGAPQDVLTEEHMRTALHVTTVQGHHDGVPYILPWKSA